MNAAPRMLRPAAKPSRRHRFSAWCAAMLSVTLLAGVSLELSAQKPDPPILGGGGNAPVAPIQKEDPTALGPNELDPAVKRRFIEKYEDDFGPAVAIEAFVTPGPNGKRLVQVDTSLLAAQVRRFWKQNHPGVDIVSLEANARNAAQKQLALGRNDPEGVAKTLALESDAELALVLKCYPAAGQPNGQAFDVEFDFLDLRTGELITSGRGVWHNPGQVLPAEILARHLTRAAWEGYAPPPQDPGINLEVRNFAVTITGLSNRDQAQQLTDEIGRWIDGRIRLDNFDDGGDQTTTRIRIRGAFDVQGLAGELEKAAEEVGVALSVSSARGREIVAVADALGTGGGDDDLIQWWQDWQVERDPRDVRLLSGWSLSKEPGNVGLPGTENQDLLGNDMMTGLANAMTDPLSPITNTALAGLRDGKLKEAFDDFDEEGLKDLLAKRFPDEIIWLVSGRPILAGKELQRVRVTVMVVDTLSAQTLAVFNDDWPKLASDERTLERKGREYVARALERLQKAEQAPARQQTVFIAGLDGVNDRDLLVDAVAAKLPTGAKGVKVRDARQADVAGEAVVELSLRVNADAAGVSRLVRSAIFDELAWPVHEYALNPAVVLRVKNALEVPEWALLTPDDKQRDQATQLLQRVEGVVSELGRPRVLTLMQTPDDTVPTETLEAIQAAVNNHLSNAGLDVLDTTTATELAQAVRSNPAYGDERSVCGFLRDQVRADWALLGYVSRDGDGLRGNFRLVDLRLMGRFVTGVTVPDPEAKSSRKVKVDRNEPLSVARYVAGRSLGGVLRLEGRPHRLEVLVQGAKSGDQVTALAQQIASNIPQVVSVENLYFDYGVAGFFVVHRGSFNHLAKQIDLIRDGLPFDLQDAKFDAGVWVLSLDAPAPPSGADVRPILPGQGVIVGRPPAVTPPAAGVDDGDHGAAPVDQPDAADAPEGVRTKVAEVPRSRLAPKVGGNDAAERFRREYAERAPLGNRKRSLDTAVSRVFNAEPLPEPDGLLVFRDAKRTRNAGGRGLPAGVGSAPLAVERVAAVRTRGENNNDLFAAAAQLEAEDPSVTLAIPNLPVQAYAGPQTKLREFQWTIRNPVNDGMDTGWFEVADRVVSSSSRLPLVAVVDEGLNTDDARLRAFLWTNPREQENGKDDDGNGLVDDVHGYHFPTKSGRLYKPGDDFNHGSFCASLIAGRPGGNADAVLGLAPGVTVLPVGVMQFDGRGSLQDILFGIAYAADQGAKVINLSLGGPIDHDSLRKLNQLELWDWLEKKGVLLVIAAGNEHNDNDRNPRFPGSLPRPNVITVAAVDPAGTIARAHAGGGRWQPFSNYGKTSVHIAAPGSTILGIPLTGQTSFSDGTSFAAPMVAAAAAVVWAQHPDWDYQTVRRAILESARPVQGLENKVATGGVLDLPAALAWRPDGNHAVGPGSGQPGSPGQPNQPPANPTQPNPTAPSPTPPNPTSPTNPTQPAPVQPVANSNVAVVIGVNELYEQDNDLRMAVPDAQAMALTLTRFGGYRVDRVNLLIDGANNGRNSPTGQRIKDVVRAAAQEAGPNDTLLFYFSGHGTQTADRDGTAQTFLVPADANVSNPDTLVSLAELRAIIDGSAAKQKAIIVDACHAGGTGEFPRLNPNEAFGGAGIVTLASCTVEQESIEVPDYQAGLFTHWVTRGLRGEARGNDQTVSVFELFQFVSGNVPSDARRMNHDQTPVFYGKITTDFPVVTVR